MNLFEPWPKISRLYSQCSVTEKIDGTNAQVYCLDPATLTREEDIAAVIGAIENKQGKVLKNDDGTASGFVFASSRKRIISPGADNFGFAHWVWENADELFRLLGPGRHYGEWWGAGIQRRYGLDVRRFSIFNAYRHGWLNEPDARVEEKVGIELYAVPMLSKGKFSSETIPHAAAALRSYGSLAAPGYMKPEGVVIHFRDNDTAFKFVLEGDDDKVAG